MKKKYRLNKQKFKAFCGKVAMVLCGGAFGCAFLMAILLSPEW